MSEYLTQLELEVKTLSREVEEMKRLIKANRGELLNLRRMFTRLNGITAHLKNSEQYLNNEITNLKNR